MKKSKTMRVASGLLVLTLLSTCMVAGTFAKYTTSDSGSDTARVAKFGVEVTANGNTFANEYKNGDAVTVKSVAGTGEQTGADVVAPGTSGNMATMTLKGTPETSVKVSYEGTFALDDNWKLADGTFYCPLVITVKSENGTTEIKQSDDIATAQQFNDAVNNAIKAYSKEYKPGTDLSGVGDDALTVTWSWPFVGNDANDTYLGNADTAANVTLAVKTTVTQID